MIFCERLFIMKINNKKLQTAINLNPTKKSQSMNIQEMCNKIDRGEITIPLYQRGLSWNNKKVVALFNYQLFGKAPVAPLSFNEIGNHNDVPQLSFITREPISSLENCKGNLSVVDGQQRLTSNYKAYSDNPDFQNIVLDVTQSRFKEINHKRQKTQIPVGVLLYKDQATLTNFLINNYTPKEYSKLLPILVGVRTKMLSYMYTIHIANDMNEDEQIDWFEVLNNAGSRVSRIELKLSKLKMHDFDIYKRFIKPYQDKVAKYGFADLFSPFSSNVSYPIASLNPAYEIQMKGGKHSKNYAPIPSDTKEAIFVKLSKPNLDKMHEITLIALDTALNFVLENGLQKYITQMQYVMYLTGYFVFNNNNLTNKNKIELINWVKNTKFVNKSNGKKREIFDELIKQAWNS